MASSNHSSPHSIPLVRLHSTIGGRGRHRDDDVDFRTAPPVHLEIATPNRFDGHQDENINPLGQNTAPTHNKKKRSKDEDEDVDALISDLESHDGDEALEGEVDIKPGDARPVAEEFLQTDIFNGLTDNEVMTRRKKFGFNQMHEVEKSLILKFLGFFVGPIQSVMEVS